MSKQVYSTNMAASYLTSTRTVLKGLHLVPGRWLQTPAACECLRRRAARCRFLLVSPAASLCSSRTGPRSGRSGQTEPRTAEEESQGPEYIPRRKAKNPMMKIGYAWMIGLPTGVIGFLLAKRQVDKNRLKQLKVRQRMRRSNEGEYEGSRYLHSTEDFKLDH